MWDLLQAGILDILDDVARASRTQGNSLLVHARSLVALAMIIFYSFRSYSIITGDEQLQITKLMRPFAILLVVLLWPNFVSFIETPIDTMEGSAKNTAIGDIARVKSLSEERERLANQLYMTMISEAVSMEKKTDEMYESGGWYERIIEGGKDFLSGQAFVDLQERFTKIFQGIHGLINAKIQFLAIKAMTWLYQVLAGVMILLIFYLQVLISGLLYLIGPFSFAISIFPAFEDSWKKWTSRFIGVQLYGLLGYVAVSAGTYLLSAVIQKDIRYYEGILSSGAETDIISAFLANNLGVATTSYVIGILVFGFSMFAIPLVAGWFTSDASAGTLGQRAIKTASEATKKAAELTAKAAAAVI